MRVAHQVARVAWIANHSLKLGVRVRWDDEAEQIAGSPERPTVH